MELAVSADVPLADVPSAFAHQLRVPSMPEIGLWHLFSASHQQQPLEPRGDSQDAQLLVVWQPLEPRGDSQDAQPLAHRSLPFEPREDS